MSDLTWSLNDGGNTSDPNEADQLYRKRSGDFTGLGSSSKKKKNGGRSAEEIITQEKGDLTCNVIVVFIIEFI